MEERNGWKEIRIRLFSSRRSGRWWKMYRMCKFKGEWVEEDEFGLNESPYNPVFHVYAKNVLEIPIYPPLLRLEFFLDKKFPFSQLLDFEPEYILFKGHLPLHDFDPFQSETIIRRIERIIYIAKAVDAFKLRKEIFRKIEYGDQEATQGNLSVYELRSGMLLREIINKIKLPIFKTIIEKCILFNHIIIINKPVYCLVIGMDGYYRLLILPQYESIKYTIFSYDHINEKITGSNTNGMVLVHRIPEKEEDVD